MRCLKLFFSCSLFLLGVLLNPGYADNCSCHVGSNQISNPDFSLGNTGFNSDMNYAANCNQGTYWIGAEPRDKCNIQSWLDDLWDNTSGDATGSYMIIDGPATATDFPYNRIWAHSVFVEDGVPFQFSFSLVPRVTNPTNVDLKLAVYLNDVLLTGPINITTDTEWKDYCFQFEANYSGPGVIQIRQVQNFAAGGYDYGLDDMYFGHCIIPEPPCEVDSKWSWQQNFTTCAISFNNLSTAGTGTTIVGYFWEFGDGTTSNEENPVHFYDDPGTFTACLTVYGVTDDGECCTDTYCRSVINHCSEKPCKANIKDIVISPVNFGNCEYQFTVDANPTSPVIGYLWNFDDGSTATGPNPSHAFASSGTYNVCVTLVLQDENKCCSETYCEKFNINCIHSGTENVRPDQPFELEKEKIESIDMRLSPNPSDDWALLEFSAEDVQSYELIIFDMQGKRMLSKQGSSEKGINKYNIETQVLPSGTYIVTVRLKDTVYSEKLIVY